ncbi:MAG: amino acid ABC transporter permease [Intrasporangium sp.]|uniref:amino acid ABC transporter permease n=1 Tax=Intrasporangium sp. TaxID=1925024 RepID=UPI002648215C|nr:amino acid ABC transporter permease [Intrasporangium sp.]MDN5797584.1 amino acid ABC transporter permease [Intrasporangium sp.]
MRSVPVQAPGGLADEDTLDLPVRPARHPGRWLGLAVVAVLAAMLVNTLLTNPRFEWDVVAQYFTSESIILGVRRTIDLTVITMLIAVLLGIVLAVLRLSPNPILSGASWLFIWFFRGTPLLVQLLVWYNLAALYPDLSLGIPFGPEFVQLEVNVLITGYAAAVLGLSLNESAYMAEIVRAGILSVDQGQTEAAQALGMSRLRTMRRVVLPQAMRVIIPPLGNDTINMLKMTSLVSVIAVPELLFASQTIYSRTFQTIPLLLVACIWYLIVVSLLSVGQYYIERRFARGATRNLPLTPFQKVKKFFGWGQRGITTTEVKE